MRKTLVTASLFSVLIGSTAEGNIFSCCADPCQFYIGVFGGGGRSNSPLVVQKATAFFVPPLDVHASGPLDHHSFAIGGAHIGYDWNCSLLNNCCGFNVCPSAELEGFYFKHLGNNDTDDLFDVNDRVPGHDLIDTLPIRGGVFLANALIRVCSPCFNQFQPYAGVGIGVTRVWITGALSLQTSPVELGINHFNSDPNSSTWTFTVQAKAGIRFNFCSRWRLFAEYRFLYLRPTSFTFGDTRYPTHVPTTRWHVDINSLHYNAGVAGIEYCL